jgi:hypothetical protein
VNKSVTVIAAVITFAISCGASPLKKNWCNPNDSSSGGGGSFGAGRLYVGKCVPDSAGPAGRKGHVEEDIEAEKEWEKQLNEDRMHRFSLRQASLTRVLTDAEMKEFLGTGSDIFVDYGIPFRQEEVDRQFEHALHIQTELLAMKMLKERGHGRSSGN